MPARSASAPRLLSQVSNGRLNRARLLQILYDYGPLSRAELARSAGVAKTTISLIVQPMIDGGLLVEGEPQPSSSVGGKPARPLWLSPEGRPTVAVHVLPTSVRAARVSPTGVVVVQALRTYSGTSDTQESITRQVLDCIEEILPAETSEVLGVGVAVGGIVDTDDGVIVDVNLAPRLSGLAIGPLLAAELGLPVSVDLHPRVQALGDRWFGAGRRAPSFASLYVAEAIGVGIVVDGEVQRGRSGAGGEVGHTTVDRRGDACSCGRRGCWETIASHRWLRARAAATGLPRARRMTVEDLAAAVRAGTAGARELLEEYAGNVAIGIVNLEQTFAPGLFILHGDVVNGGDTLRELLRAEVVRQVARRPGGDPEIVFAAPRDDAVLRGAAGLVLSQSLEELA